MKKRYYIIIAAVSYLFFTLGNVPAAKVISLAEQSTKLPMQLYGVHGSLWNGGAEKAIVKGQPHINNLSWSINPAMLLLASLSGEVKGSIKNQNIVGNISYSAFGSFSASDVRATIDAATAQELLKLPMGELSGTFNVNIESFSPNPEGIPEITAQIKWKNAKVTIIDTVDLGLVNLNITPDDNEQLIAKISSKNGHLLLNGKAKIDNKKTYDLNLSITPEKKANENLRQSLKLFSKRQTDGTYLVKRKGKLSELGI